MYIYIYKIFAKEISNELSRRIKKKKKKQSRRSKSFFLFHLFEIEVDTFTDDLVPASFIIGPENKFSEQETHK